MVANRQVHGSRDVVMTSLVRRVGCVSNRVARVTCDLRHMSDTPQQGICMNYPTRPAKAEDMPRPVLCVGCGAERTRQAADWRIGWYQPRARGEAGSVGPICPQCQVAKLEKQ